MRYISLLWHCLYCHLHALLFFSSQTRRSTLRAQHKNKSGENTSLKKTYKLTSQWQDSTYKYYEIILVDPQHKAIRRDARINWICNPVHKHREARGLTAAGRKNRGIGKGHLYNNTPKFAKWKKRNTLSLPRYR